MKASIKGLIERLDLSGSRGLMPLFEAISNAIDAVTERGQGLGKGQIRIVLVYANDLATEGGDQTPVVTGVDVVDNGIGFGSPQLASFEEAYTLAKVRTGGKGVGRFTYLKAFESVSIRSVFADGEKRYLRDFNFSIENEVEGAEVVREVVEDTGTRVSLRGLNKKYLPSWPRDVDQLAQKVIAHFLIRFASRGCPAMYLEAPGHERIELNDLFDRTVQPHINEVKVTVGKEEFSIQVFRNRDGRARHDLHYCANGREVLTGKLKDLLPELPDCLVDPVKEENYALKALVTGDYLDRHSNQQRTEIAFRADSGELELGDELLKRQEIDSAISGTLRDLLKDDLRKTNEEKIGQIEQFVATAPEYRALTSEKYRPLLEARIPPGLSSEKLDEALLHVRREIEDNVRKEERVIAALMERESFEAYKTQIQALIESMNEVGKAKLADYVAHRRVILDLFDRNLKKRRGDDAYPLERVLHDLIFPMGCDSRDVFLEQQNLWVIDERLCFHTLLTSDRTLKSIPGLEGTTKNRPDILAFFYDVPVGLAEPEDGSGAVVIIEFKRPGRDDYSKDPASQIIDQFVEIMDGRVRDIDGRPVNPTHLRFVGYLIADLTPSLQRQVKMKYHQSVDGEGYYVTLATGNGYVEIISYDKLLRDAQRRNRVLFEKLGLHKN